MNTEDTWSQYQVKNTTFSYKGTGTRSLTNNLYFVKNGDNKPGRKGRKELVRERYVHYPYYKTAFMNYELTLLSELTDLSERYYLPTNARGVLEVYKSELVTMLDSPIAERTRPATSFSCICKYRITDREDILRRVVHICRKQYFV